MSELQQQSRIQKKSTLLISAWLSTKSQWALASTSVRWWRVAFWCKKNRWPATVAITGGRADEGYTRLGSFGSIRVHRAIGCLPSVCRNTKMSCLTSFQNVRKYELPLNCNWIAALAHCALMQLGMPLPLDVMLHYMHCQAKEESRRRRRWVYETSTQYNSRPTVSVFSVNRIEIDLHFEVCKIVSDLLGLGSKYSRAFKCFR